MRVLVRRSETVRKKYSTYRSTYIPTGNPLSPRYLRIGQGYVIRVSAINLEKGRVIELSFGALFLCSAPLLRPDDGNWQPPPGMLSLAVI